METWRLKQISVQYLIVIYYSTTIKFVVNVLQVRISVLASVENTAYSCRTPGQDSKDENNTETDKE